MRLNLTGKIKISTITCVGFIIVSFLIFRTDLPKFPTIFLYNIIILAACQGLGFYRGLFFLGASIFLTILISIATSFYYVWSIPIFFISFFIAENRIKRLDYYRHIIGARIDEVKENTNILVNTHARHKREMVFLERKEDKYKSLKDAASTLASSLSLDRVTELLLDNILHVIGKTETVLLFLVDTEAQELNLVSSRMARHFKNSVKSKKGDFLDEWVFKQRQRLFVEDIKKDFRFSEEKTLEHHRSYRSMISCPLVEENKLIGIVRLEHSKPNNYTSEDLRLLDILCDIGAVSLQNASLYKQTLDLAITDSLTGLYLRRYFLERFSEELSRSLRSDLEVSILMIDIDNFKDYNDKYGHMAGDIALKTISKAIEGVAENAIIARYGGEEFCALLPETGKKAAKNMADKLRKTIKSEAIELRRLKTNVTVSIGVASFPDDAKVQDELIQKADERLYRAKRQGRDRVVTE